MNKDDLYAGTDGLSKAAADLIASARIMQARHEAERNGEPERIDWSKVTTSLGAAEINS